MPKLLPLTSHIPRGDWGNILVIGDAPDVPVEGMHILRHTTEQHLENASAISELAALLFNVRFDQNLYVTEGSCCILLVPDLPIIPEVYDAAKKLIKIIPILNQWLDLMAEKTSGIANPTAEIERIEQAIPFRPAETIRRALINIAASTSRQFTMADIDAHAETLRIPPKSQLIGQTVQRNRSEPSARVAAIERHVAITTTAGVTHLVPYATVNDTPTPGSKLRLDNQHKRKHGKWATAKGCSIILGTEKHGEKNEKTETVTPMRHIIRTDKHE